MDLSSLAANAQIFFLIFARVIAMLEIAPLFSSSGIPRIARIGLAMLCAAILLPQLRSIYTPVPDQALAYVLLLAGEALIGIITAFYLVIIYGTFQVAGEFFSLQMGFGASSVFDPLAQVELPIMGQFFNIAAMFVFLSVSGFQKLFLTGVIGSFHAVRAVDFATFHSDFAALFLSSLTHLFEQALIISMPILGTLFLVEVVMGLLAKAAPQLNLLMLGFPLAIIVAFAMMLLALPMIMAFFGNVIEAGFSGLTNAFIHIEAGSTAAALHPAAGGTAP